MKLEIRCGVLGRVFAEHAFIKYIVRSYKMIGLMTHHLMFPTKLALKPRIYITIANRLV